MQRPGPPAKIGSTPPPPRQSNLPPRPSAPPPGVALTPELAAFRQRIIDRVATINDEDYFEVLGLPREAPAQAVQAAFLALAKIWHPDRLAPQLFDVKDFSVKIFARMNDARNTLTSSDLRDAYITQLRRGIRHDPVAHEETNAPLEFQKAEFYLKKRDYAQAEAHCRRAREAEPANADYVALLVWIAVERDGAQIPPEHLHDHIEALTMAIKLNERCERAFFYRAQLWKRINRPEKAHQDFKAVVEINPKNIDAARETHLYKRRST
jgi:tetratricopeptide (TPR) repeat protein